MPRAIALLLALLPVVAGTVRAQPPGPRRVAVDCEAGGSIAAALRLPADELLIEIRGLCVESVEVSRDRVTLRGGNPFRDGIEAPADGAEAPLTLRGAGRVTVENLRLTGGRRSGLAVFGGHDRIEVLYSRLDGNRRWGAELVDASVRFEGSVLTGNGEDGEGSPAGGGLLASRGASARLVDCVLAENPAAGRNYGVAAFAHSTVRMTGGEAEGAIGALARVYSSISLTDTRLTGGDWALETNIYGRVAVRGGLMSGPFLVATRSAVELLGVTQTENASQNFVAERSTLLAADRTGADEEADEPTTLDGLTVLTDHADGKLEGSTLVEELNCALGSRVICDDTVVAAVSSGCDCP